MLAAARRLFAANGCTQTSVGAVAAEADVNHALVDRAPATNECHNSVTGFPALVRIACHLTRGNRQPCARRLGSCL
ncbi:MAG: TetR family transcriptional regulator [Trebonia sp.]